MTNADRLAHVEAQILAVRRLLWDASEMRSGRVCALAVQLDALVDEKYRLLAA